METIHFSIIMPVYNSQNYLDKTIDSVLRQSYKNFTLILINDGSTDQSGIMCDHYAMKDDRIIVLHKKNEGICKTRNIGLDIAEGQYIYFMDNDDTLYHNALEIMHHSVQDDLPDLLFFGSQLINMQNNKITSSISRMLPNFFYEIKHDIANQFAELLEVGMLFCVWDKLYKTEFLKKNNIRFNPIFTHGGEDIDFNLQLFPFIKKVKNIDDILYYYYLRDVQSTYRKFNRNVYEHAILNLNSMITVASDLGVNITAFIYLRYIEYKMRLVFMLGHKDSTMNLGGNIKFCREQFEKDGCSKKFKRKSYLFFLKQENISVKKKILVSTIYLKLYNLTFFLINQYSKSW